MDDTWSLGGAYESYVGRWSRLVAAEFLAWLDLPPGLRWLDVGCGTGALSEQVLADRDPRTVLGVDRSEPYVGWAARHVTDPRARFAVADATQLAGAFGVGENDIADVVADVVVSGLMLNFLPDPAAALAAMRTVAPTGTVAAYVWDYAGRMDLIRLFWDAAAALDPAARDVDEGRRFPICAPGPLEALWHGAGLVEVTSTAIDVPTTFACFDDFWAPFLGGQGPAPGYLLTLDDAQRAAVRERLRATLPVAADATITLTARAWAVRGRSPQLPV